MYGERYPTLGGGASTGCYGLNDGTTRHSRESALAAETS